MALTVRIAALIGFSSALGVAGSWSGSLVDSRCYANEERNVNPNDTETSVDRDSNSEIRYCSPTAKTKSFAVVQHDGMIFRLDAAGNTKAAELVRKTGRKSPFPVVVTG